MELQAFTITGVVITIIGGVVTAIIVQELYKWKEKRIIMKSKLTGTWTLTIYTKYPDEYRAIDIVNCKHNAKTEHVSGKVIRSYPIGVDKQWEFSGRFRNNIIYLTYWPIRGTASSGTIIMNFDEEKKEFLGKYMKYIFAATDTINSTNQLVNTDIGWKFGSPEKNYKSLSFPAIKKKDR